MTAPPTAITRRTRMVWLSVDAEAAEPPLDRRGGPVGERDTLLAFLSRLAV
jgi:hypothetical protein